MDRDLEEARIDLINSQQKLTSQKLRNEDLEGEYAREQRLTEDIQDRARH